MKSKVYGVLVALGLVVCFAFKADHDFHVSTSELNYNQDRGVYELTLQTFTDDMLDLSESTQWDSIKIKEHTLHNFKLFDYRSEKLCNVSFLGYEAEGHDFYIYMEFKTESPQVLIENRFLIDIFEEQKNVVKAKKGAVFQSLLFDITTTKNVFLP